MKKILVLALLLVFVFISTIHADENKNALTRISDEFYNHIFGITNHSIANTIQDLPIVAPDLHNGGRLIEAIDGAYFWRITGYSECNITTGTKSASISCFERFNNGHAKLVEDESCTGINKPVETVFCSTGSTQYMWSKSYAGTCSTTCGTGTKTYQFSCLQVEPNGKRVLRENQVCELFLGPASSGSEPCIDYSECGYSWKSSEWSECSNLCTDSRIQTRSNQCLEEKTQTVVDNSLCTGQEPIASQNCTNECVYLTTCLDVLTHNPESLDGYYDLSVNGVKTQKYCDMSNGGFTYVGRYTLPARSYGTLTPWFEFNSIKVNYISGKITCSSTNHCPPSTSAIAMYNPSRDLRAISYPGQTYIYNTALYQTYLRYGDAERLSGGIYSDNSGSVIADFYLK